jgi:protein-export membrane protein SecD
LAIVVISSLGIAGLLTYALIVILGMGMGYALNLPGIAGAIVAIGVTADSFIIYFERIRDEIKAGAPPIRAINSGYDKAIRAVLDGNITTLICAIVLFQFGAGPIRGFAVTLSIGILTTLFTCLPLARLLIGAFGGRKIGFVRVKKNGAANGF